MVVQTGGGYSETEVVELDGRRLWRYRPSESLPPTALRPADLDGDGEIELYATDGGRVIRLDGEGGEVWSRESTYGAALLLAPSFGERPAWVVGTGFVGGHSTYRVWNENGDLLGELVGPEERGRPASLTSTLAGCW